MVFLSGITFERRLSLQENSVCPVTNTRHFPPPLFFSTSSIGLFSVISPPHQLRNAERSRACQCDRGTREKQDGKAPQRLRLRSGSCSRVLLAGGRALVQVWVWSAGQSSGSPGPPSGSVIGLKDLQNLEKPQMRFIAVKRHR